MCQFSPPIRQLLPVAPPAPRARWVSLCGSLVVMVVGLLGWANPAQAQLTQPVNVTSLITTPQAGITTNFPTAAFADPCDSTAATGFPGCDNPVNTVNLTFGGGNELVLNAVIAAGNRFEPATELLPPAGLPERIVFRRAGTAPGGLTDRQLLFYASSTANPTTITLDSS
ncbi:MAG TPA: hypothetical protein VLS96_16755, partial [Nodosilinea sp.]|nr:hypothetical protein [Nodosilinea sp.]